MYEVRPNEGNADHAALKFDSMPDKLEFALDFWRKRAAAVQHHPARRNKIMLTHTQTADAAPYQFRKFRERLASTSTS